MIGVITEHKGVLDKVIGESILAYWGAAADAPGAEMAGRAALAMVESLKKLNDGWAMHEFPKLRIGIGLHTGEVVLGRFRVGNKVEVTAIGDSVNVTARLEASNKEFGTTIVMSEATRRELGERARVRSLGSVVIKGKAASMETFELLGMSSAQLTPRGTVTG